MRHVYSLLLIFLWLAPTFMSAQSASEKPQPLVDSYLKDLEELGYCVIPQILSNAETELLRTHFLPGQQPCLKGRKESL